MPYTCKDRPLLPPASERFSPRCNYDRRERDAGCEGCRFRVAERLDATNHITERETEGGLHNAR